MSIHVERIGSEYELWDADHDTGIQVEKTADDDTIRIDIGGATPIIDAFTLDQTNGLVWNNGQDTLSARFSSPTYSHLFFIDSINESIGFNTDDPTFIRNGSSKGTMFGVVKPDKSAINAGFFAVSTETETLAADVSFLKSKGTWASKTALVNNDVICNLGFEGHDGTDFIRSSLIRATVDGTVSTNIVPIEILFLTGSVNGGSNSSLRLRSNGKVNFGGTRAAPEIKFDSLTGAAIFNEQGNDADFRVESSVETHNLFIDGGSGYTGISNSAPNSILDIGGSITLPYTTKTSAYILTDKDHTVDCTGTFTVILPTAVGITGRIYNIKNSGTGTITLDGNGSQTIDGSLTVSIGAGISITVQSTGSAWIII